VLKNYRNAQPFSDTIKKECPKIELVMLLSNKEEMRVVNWIFLNDKIKTI
jgi:hypothetical protein